MSNTACPVEFERRKKPRRRAIEWPKVLPHNQDQAEVRILSAILVMIFTYYLIIEPVLFSMNVEQSVLSKVMHTSRFHNGLYAGFIFCGLSMIPHFISLLFMPRYLGCTLPRQMAVTGAAGVGYLWFMLANLARPLDFNELEYIYSMRVGSCAFVALVFAFSLNSQQIREKMNAAKTVD